MDEESFLHGAGVCYVCKLLALPQEGAFFLGAPFHEACLNRVGNGWRDKIQPHPKALFDWLLENSSLPVEFAVSGESSF